MSLTTTVQRNFSAVHDRMAAAAERAGRDPGAVQLVAVSKFAHVDAIRALRDLGQEHFGESRVEAAQPKIEALSGSGIIWHLIGNLQRRKTKDAVRTFDRIDAVDRLALAESIASRCSEYDLRSELLIEVNVSGEVQKHGFAPAVLDSTLAEIAGMERLRVRGLMTMAPLDASPENIRTVFETLASLAEDYDLQDVSMGMSNDFELAIEAGATEIRVGSALFEGI